MASFALIPQSFSVFNLTNGSKPPPCLMFNQLRRGAATSIYVSLPSPLGFSKTYFTRTCLFHTHLAKETIKEGERTPGAQKAQEQASGFDFQSYMLHKANLVNQALDIAVPPWGFRRRSTRRCATRSWRAGSGFALCSALLRVSLSEGTRSRPCPLCVRSRWSTPCQWSMMISLPWTTTTSGGGNPPITRCSVRISLSSQEMLSWH